MNHGLDYLCVSRDLAMKGMHLRPLPTIRSSELSEISPSLNLKVSPFCPTGLVSYINDRRIDSLRSRDLHRADGMVTSTTPLLGAVGTLIGGEERVTLTSASGFVICLPPEMSATGDGSIEVAGRKDGGNPARYLCL